MNKSLIFIIILILLGMIIAISNAENIHNTFLDVKTILQGEANKEPIAILSNDTIESSKNNLKVYNKSGIYFKYPSYWDYDYFRNLLALYQQEHINRWDDGVIFYISNRFLQEELEYQKKYGRYKDSKNIVVDGKNAYSLTAIKKDYWQYLIIVEKNRHQSYVFIFYTDQDLKKRNKVLFDGILATMRLA